MKNLLWLVCLAIVSPYAVCAQEPGQPVPRSDNNFFVPNPEPRAQAELGYPHYETPRQLVIRNAALQGAQRRERMAINARFGYSPSRPPSSTMPFMGSPIGPPTAVPVYTIYPGFVFPRPYSRN